jgi:predicted nucleic acid-binding protein
MMDGPNAKHYATLILDPEGSKNLILPSICLQEVFRISLREQGAEKADNVAGFMKSRAAVVAHDAALALEAAALGHRYKLALADSIVYATAIAFRAKLWTQDSAFEGLPGVEFKSKF